MVSKRFNKKRFNKKRFNKVLRKPRPQGVHFFKRTMLTTFTLDNSAWTSLSIGSGANNYHFNDLPNNTDFVNIYDEYKICAIKNKYVFTKNSLELGTATTTSIPVLVTVNDYNSNVALASENSALEYPSCKMSRLDKVVTRYFKPRFDINGSGVTTNYSDVTKRGYVNTISATRPHYGLFSCISAGNSADVIGTLKVYTTYYIACRHPK